jgi:ABC-2 type transport system ATP-binding protein
VNLVRFDRIRKSFGDKLVLDDLSLTVDSGEVYGLLGPNGCGKSTAINLLCNLLDPDGGAIEIAGRAVSGDVTSLVGICPQDIALYRDLYPGENLRFFAQIYGLPSADRERRASELMQLFGLEGFARTPVGALSGGWQRRVHIAVALVHSPAILVLDEPTSAVDLEARHELWQLIDTLKRTGTTILLTTHHLDEAEHLCSRIGIMKNGRIAKEGTVAELLAAVPAKAIALVETAKEEAVLRRAGELGWGIRHYAGKIGCLLPQQVSLRAVVDALQDVDVSAVSLQRVSLEHAYLEVVQSERERF